MGVSPGAESFGFFVVAMGLNYHFPWRGTSGIFPYSELRAPWLCSASNNLDVDACFNAVSKDIKSTQSYL